MRRFFLLYVILLPSVSFFCFSPLYFFLCCRLSVGGRSLIRGHHEREIHGLQFFSAFLFNFFSPLNFRFLIFFCLCVFYPPTRCCRCYNADLKHLFCIFVMCAFFSLFCSPFMLVSCFGMEFLCEIFLATKLQ